MPGQLQLFTIEWGYITKAGKLMRCKNRGQAEKAAGWLDRLLGIAEGSSLRYKFDDSGWHSL